MEISILTLFPEYFAGIFDTSILKRAGQTKAVSYTIYNIRDFTTDKHRRTDDRPYGGGAGMALKVEPIFNALQHIQALPNQKDESTRVVLTAAGGAEYTQQMARRFTSLQRLIIICGHYEGVDQRVADHLVDQQVRIGNYVLTGGEAAAAVITDSVTRLLPGVLGNDQSLTNESHDQPGQLSYPVYTRPEVFQGWTVPDTLLTGHHQAITDWREHHTNYESIVTEMDKNND